MRVRAMQEETGARGGGTDGGAPCAHGIRIQQHSGVPGESLCGDAAGGGGAALETVVLDGVDVLLDVWPEVLGNTERRRQRKVPITITAHAGGGRGWEGNTWSRDPRASPTASWLLSLVARPSPPRLGPLGALRARARRERILSATTATVLGARDSGADGRERDREGERARRRDAP